MMSGGGSVAISNIERPIEQKHTGKGNPNAILHYGTPLNNRQQQLLDRLPGFDSRATFDKKTVNMADLAALTAKTGDEFAMFTKGRERLVVRGDKEIVNVDLDEAGALAEQGYRWSGHTHPGIGDFVKTASAGDKNILRKFRQSRSVIYDSKGAYETYGKD
jgi:hypothetical protein